MKNYDDLAVWRFGANFIPSTAINQLEMWYQDRFQIVLGDVSGLDEKITWIKTAIETQLSTYDSGVLDVSQAVQPVPGEEYKVIYTPFD